MQNVIQWLVSFVLVLPSAAFATDWVKVGSDREADVYYDRESLRIVHYIVQTDQNRNNWPTPSTPKALLVKILYNYFVPTMCPEKTCVDQPVSSTTYEWAITCNGNPPLLQGSQK